MVEMPPLEVLGHDIGEGDVVIAERHVPVERSNLGDLARRVTIATVDDLVMPYIDWFFQPVLFDVGGKVFERLAHHHRKNVGEPMGRVGPAGEPFAVDLSVEHGCIPCCI